MLARRFKREFGRAPNLKNPRTFNEKLLWLMLYYRTPLATRLADKYEVRGYVAERVGPERLNELYGVWDRVSDIDFDTLPDAFVLKVNWGWGRTCFAGGDPSSTCRRRRSSWPRGCAEVTIGRRGSGATRTSSRASSASGS